MTDTEALVLLFGWLAIFVTMFTAVALLIVSAVVVERPAGYLNFREVLIPLLCLLAGGEQRDRLQEILRARETASGTLRDVARYRARHAVTGHQAQHARVADVCRPERYPLLGGSPFLYYYPEKQLLDRDQDDGYGRWPDFDLPRFIDILSV